MNEIGVLNLDFSQFSQKALKKIAARAISCIKEPEKGIGTELFESIFNIVPQPCVEAVIVDNIENPRELLITRRSEKNVTYAGRWHCPGTYIRRGETNPIALRRCIKIELGIGIRKYRFSGVIYNDSYGCDAKEGSQKNEKRHTVGLVYLVELTGRPRTDVGYRWIDFNPGNILSTHRDFVRDALGWKKTKRKIK